MADRVLFDTNIALDFVLKRQPGFSEAQLIWRANAIGKIRGYVTASSMTDIYYFASNKGNDTVRGYKAITMCLATLEICTVDRTMIEQAAVLKRKDFEDSVQIMAALAEGLDAIVTRNIKDFRGAGITLYTPAQLVKRLKLR